MFATWCRQPFVVTRLIREPVHKCGEILSGELPFEWRGGVLVVAFEGE